MRMPERSKVKVATKISLHFSRSADEFRNLTIVELPNGDYGFTIMRNFLFTAFQRELWAALQASADIATCPRLRARA